MDMSPAQPTAIAPAVATAATMEIPSLADALGSVESRIDIKVMHAAEDPDRASKFHETVLAVYDIIERKLYREKNMNIEAYFKSHWNISRAQAYRLYNCGAIVRELAQSFHILPTRERYCRILKKCTGNASERQQLWAELLRLTDGNEARISSNMIVATWDRLSGRVSATSPAVMAVPTRTPPPPLKPLDFSPQPQYQQFPAYQQQPQQQLQQQQQPRQHHNSSPVGGVVFTGRDLHGAVVRRSSAAVVGHNGGAGSGTPAARWGAGTGGGNNADGATTYSNGMPVIGGRPLAGPMRAYSYTHGMMPASRARSHPYGARTMTGGALYGGAGGHYASGATDASTPSTWHWRPQSASAAMEHAVATASMWPSGWHTWPQPSPAQPLPPGRTLPLPLSTGSVAMDVTATGPAASAPSPAAAQVPVPQHTHTPPPPPQSDKTATTATTATTASQPSAQQQHQQRLQSPRLQLSVDNVVVAEWNHHADEQQHFAHGSGASRHSERSMRRDSSRERTMAAATSLSSMAAPPARRRSTADALAYSHQQHGAASQQSQLQQQQPQAAPLPNNPQSALSSQSSVGTSSGGEYDPPIVSPAFSGFSSGVRKSTSSTALDLEMSRTMRQYSVTSSFSGSSGVSPRARGSIAPTTGSSDGSHLFLSSSMAVPGGGASNGNQMGSNGSCNTVVDSTTGSNIHGSSSSTDQRSATATSAADVANSATLGDSSSAVNGTAGGGGNNNSSSAISNGKYGRRRSQDALLSMERLSFDPQPNKQLDTHPEESPASVRRQFRAGAQVAYMPGGSGEAAYGSSESTHSTSRHHHHPHQNGHNGHHHNSGAQGSDAAVPLGHFGGGEQPPWHLQQRAIFPYSNGAGAPGVAFSSATTHSGTAGIMGAPVPVPTTVADWIQQQQQQQQQHHHGGGQLRSQRGVDSQSTESLAAKIGFLLNDVQ